MSASAGSRDALTNHDIAIQLGVGGAVDRSHAALAELGGDPVVRDALPDHFTRLLTSSKKFSSTVTCSGPASSASGAGMMTKRFPSGAMSKPCSPREPKR